ncbi:MAG TPA: 4-hydroxythreonine-4-phosphate dehydrogenase PdxA [Syntrophobacteraceae bacterium]|nr:4-hydroxythreonine-4-phosphate dehydrogenase PdxA [Syntrophobacteraceae bacterium]
MKPSSLGLKPRVAVTMGDPCGIGPEILVKVLASSDVRDICTPVVVGDPGALRQAMALTGIRLDLRVIGEISVLDAPESPGQGIVLCPRELSGADIRYRNPSRATCEAVVLYIETAVRAAMTGAVRAVCTCPIHKAHLHRHGFPFPGHTEYLRDLTRAEHAVMMLAGPKLRVSLVTVHQAIAEVPRVLTRERIAEVIRVTGEALVRDFGIESPRIAVAGLNPHAGEEGAFGREESELIQPALEDARSPHWEVFGPYPSDTVFLRGHRGEFDAVVAMYHDQGLIPIKLVHFHDAVNVTLGLPIIRTSVDHGTAYDLAGRGIADEGSLRSAIELAVFMARNRLSSPVSRAGTAGPFSG